MNRPDDRTEPTPPIESPDDATEAADEMAKDALRTITGGNHPESERDRRMNAEEAGGPYVPSDAQRELGAEDLDEEWTREPEPAPMRGD